MSEHHLVFDQKVELAYQYTVGRVQRAFLRGLTEQRLLASTDGRRRFVPARPFAPDGTRLDEVIPVEARGAVVVATTAHHLPGAPVFGLVHIEGTQGPMLHRLEELLEPGTLVEPVWEPGAAPAILAIRAFRRVG